MRNITRELGQATIVASGQDTIVLPRDYAYVDMLVELTATLTRTAGTTDGIVRDLAPAQLLRQIEIRANGRDVIKSLDFEGLCRLTQLRYGTGGNNTIMVGTATTACYIYGIIPFAMWRSVKPFDTLFNAKPLTTLEAILTFGAITDCFTTTYDATYALSGAVVYISGREAVGLADNQILPVNKESAQEATLTATQTDFPLNLNYAKDLAYRSIVLRAKVDNVVSNAVINNVQLKSGGVIFFNMNSRRLRARNKYIYQQETMPTGYYVIDFCEDGRLGDSLDTSGLSSLTLIIDGTQSGTTDKIKVYTTEIIIPTVVK
jgi:hypothetical protein